MALNKRQKAIQAAVEPGKAYPIDDALKIIKGFNKAKFVEAIDVAVRLGVDAKKSDQQVRGSTVLPAGTGKKLPRYPTVPAVRMGRLAVDQAFKGQGLGGALLADALDRAARSEIAAFALMVDAKDETAAAFYPDFDTTK